MTENYLDERKLARITKFFKHDDPDAIKLNIRIEHFKKHSAYSIEMELRANRNKFIGTEESHSLQKGLDLALDRVVAQVRKKSS